MMRESKPDRSMAVGEWILAVQSHNRSLFGSPLSVASSAIILPHGHDVPDTVARRRRC